MRIWLPAILSILLLVSCSQNNPVPVKESPQGIIETQINETAILNKTQSSIEVPHEPQIQTSRSFDKSAKEIRDICNTMSYVPRRELCLSIIPLRTKDPTICKELNTSDEGEDSCILRVAFETKNLTACDLMQAANGSDACKMIILLDNKTKSKSDCLKIPNLDFRDICLWDTFHYNESEIPCPTLKDKYLKKRCYYDAALELNDEKFCEETDSKEYCVTDIAEQTGNLKLCEKIRTDALYPDCLARTTASKNNISLCQLQDKQEVANYCIWLIINRSSDDSLCQMLPIGDALQELCTLKHLKDSSDISKCNKMGFAKAACFGIIANITRKQEYCDYWTDWLPKFGCILEVAKRQQNMATCMITNEEYDRANCAFSISRVTGNFSLCEKITPTGSTGYEWKEICELNALLTRYYPKYISYINELIANRISGRPDIYESTALNHLKYYYLLERLNNTIAGHSEADQFYSIS